MQSSHGSAIPAIANRNFDRRYSYKTLPHSAKTTVEAAKFWTIDTQRKFRNFNSLLNDRAVTCCQLAYRVPRPLLLPPGHHVFESEDKFTNHGANVLSIRLLEVISADEESGIECSLRTIHGLDREEYHCLSYTWGDPFGRGDTPKQSVKCGDGYLEIPANLWNALIQLFEMRREELKSIWIDAICINQGNEEEKSGQVGIMHKIYSSAKSVIIWLGPLGPEEEDKRNFPKVLKVASLLMEQENDQPGFCDGMQEMRDGEVAEKQVIPRIDGINCSHWLAVRKFLQRRYFRRMWVFQEVVAAQELIAICGSQLLNWEDVRNLSLAFTYFGIDKLTRYITRGFRAEDWGTLHNLSFYRDYYRNREGGLRTQFGPFVLLINRNYFECGNARDKLYAHRGICNKEDLLGMPRYETPIAQVYTEFWREAFERLGDINFLTFIEDDSSSVNRYKHLEPEKFKEADDFYPLPSWVPDFQAKLGPASLTEHYREGFNVSGGLPKTTFSVCYSSNRLTLHGYLFDTIAEYGECGEELVRKHTIERTLSLMESLLDEYESLDEAKRRSREHPFEAVWQTMGILTDIAGSENDYPVPKIVRETFRLWLLHILATFSAYKLAIREFDICYGSRLNRMNKLDKTGLIPSLQSVKEAAMELKKFMAQKAASGGQTHPVMWAPTITVDAALDARESSVPAQRNSNVFMEFLMICRERVRKILDASNIPNTLSHVGMTVSCFGNVALRTMRLFRTRSFYVGKGPPSMRAGDEIWIIPGARVPLIIRRLGEGRSRLVGHVHIHGIMNGELVEKWKDSELQAVVLE